MDSKPKESRIITFLLKNVNKICVASYIIGILAFLALPYRDLSEYHYHSENALLTGLQESHFGAGETRDALKYNKIISALVKNGDSSVLHDKLIEIMQQFGINSYKQKFSIKSPLPQTVNGELVQQIRNGTNVYGFIRAGRASSTESIVLNIPISKGKYNHAIGFALSFGSNIRSQPYWAKDIVLLFTETGYLGAQAWLQTYYDTKNSDFINSEPLEERAGSILAALVLDLPESTSYINAEVVGNNGQLPNLDLFNVLTKLSNKHRVPVSVGGVLTTNRYHPLSMKGYLQSLKTTVKMMSKQAKGFSSINHAMFLQHNIQSLSVQGVYSSRYGDIDLGSIGRVTEGIFRSLNNLLEKLHHSYFFYLISATDRFISIVLYMPPFGLILLAPTLKALCLWLEMRKQDEKEEEEKGVKDNDDEQIESIEEIIKSRKLPATVDIDNKDSDWMELFYILAVCHLVGVVLYFSPKFSSAWSEMFHIPVDESLVLIFLSTFLASLALPFTSIFRFSPDSKALHLLRVVALVLYAVTLGCVAVMNFSLAMVTAVISVPFVTSISPNSRRLKPLYAAMAILASPVVVALTSAALNQYFFNIKIDFWASASYILKGPYEQYLLGNSWNYQFACLLLYPNWMLFWFLSLSITRES
uniref:glycosylphosphatidylinositol anchor attachment 1 protein-like n=1 Tax=Styela clava TaxID=7725 RepID=UPI0019397239|nr:glycosylphosphatidylinositol anchor attachment 1 protein-like [Styela clava]